VRWFYEVVYGRLRAPWDVGPRPELVELVESGRLKPCRAIDLGSGTASNCIFLAQHGFHVTGVDFAQAAIDLGVRRAEAAGVSVRFVRDDLTNLQNVEGPFDLLVDYGTLDDLAPADRDRYQSNIQALTHSGTVFLLYAFEWRMRWWETVLLKVFSFFGHMALEPGEVERRFGSDFEIERIGGAGGLRGWPRGYGVYLMRRRT
jgi:SAM-dependent methyltransferase